MAGAIVLLFPAHDWSESARGQPQSTNTLLFLYTDHLGSVGLAMNAQGTPVSQQEYAPWGAVWLGISSSPTS